MLGPVLIKNDKRASRIIIVLSLIVFLAVALLSRLKLSINLGFNPHIFAKLNAIINSMVAVLLLAGLIAVKSKKYIAHKRIMLAAMVLSILFLLSYIAHHLLAGETKFGGSDSARTFYYIILFSHIPLAGIILPFILLTAYRSLIGEFERHKKLARLTWPVWFYVAVTGVIVYVMISPYYV